MEHNSDLEKGNDFDDYEEDLESFFELDDATLESLVDALNKHGANLSITSFARITGYATGSDAPRYRGMLGYLVHVYTHHLEAFKEHAAKTKVDKKHVDALVRFIEKLDKKGREGLNLLYEAGDLLKGYPVLAGVSVVGGNSIQVKEVLSENGDALGYMPFLNLRVTLKDSNGKTENRLMFMTFEYILQMIEGLKSLYDDSLAQAKKYRNTMGNSVIIPEGD